MEFAISFIIGAGVRGAAGKAYSSFWVRAYITSMSDLAALPTHLKMFAVEPAPYKYGAYLTMAFVDGIRALFVTEVATRFAKLALSLGR